MFHAGDGNLHPLIMYNVNDPAEAQKAEDAGNDILKLCVEVGGCLTGEHGVGIEKRDLMRHQFTQDDLEQQMRVRAVFDPQMAAQSRQGLPARRTGGRVMSAGVGTVLSNALAPRDEADLAEAVSAARAARSPLLIAGNGSKSAIGRPAQVERTLSTLAMSGITLYEPSEMVIGARAGTPLKLVEETLAARGQALTFEPLDYRALLGSSRRTNDRCGCCRQSLGPATHHGRGVPGQPDRRSHGQWPGQVVKSGGRVMKNVTGLDLVKLSAGSWGTLGVFSEVIFKVLPMTEQVATLVLHGLDDRRAISALAAGLGSPFEVSGAAHLPASIERVPKTLLRLEGFAASVDYRIGELRRLLRGFGTADVISGETAAGLWRSVRDASFLAEPRGSAVWRISIAPGKAAALVGQLTGVLSIAPLLRLGRRPRLACHGRSGRRRRSRHPRCPRGHGRLCDAHPRTVRNPRVRAACSSPCPSR